MFAPDGPESIPLVALPVAPGRILVADDNAASLRLVSRLLMRDRHTVLTETDSRRVVDRVTREQPDLVILDVVMPGPDGFEICRALKRDPNTLLTPVVLATALANPTDRLRGIDAGADDFLTKPLDPAELSARVRSLLRLKRYTDELEWADSVILSLALTVEARDVYTQGHCERLAMYATALGRALGLPAESLHALRRGGFLHDVGKIGVPDAILLKPGPLSVDEHRIMQDHTLIGDRLCGQLRSLREVRMIVRHHHERLDGSGYPDHLTGNAIPLLAQIMSIVDVYDALTTDRPYRTAMPTADALGELRNEAAVGWKSRELVDAFVTVLRTCDFTARAV
jgi:putative two-component system response regulator